MFAVFQNFRILLMWIHVCVFKGWMEYYTYSFVHQGGLPILHSDNTFSHPYVVTTHTVLSADAI